MFNTDHSRLEMDLDAFNTMRVTLDDIHKQNTRMQQQIQVNDRVINQLSYMLGSEKRKPSGGAITAGGTIVSVPGSITITE